MKQYTIIGGVNGVGKSSLSGVLRRQLSDMGMIIDPDTIAVQQHCDRLTAGKNAIAKVKECLQKGINFSQETTLSGRRTLRTIQQAREENYFIRLYYVGISTAEESLYRIANRVRKGGHNIPEHDVLRRYEKRFADLAEVLPYCDEVHFYDNENGFREVAIYQNGDMIPQAEQLPKWLHDFIEYQKKTAG
ncbi:hypothetical protein [uncultured Ruminococcus sp.]|uniref:hypothetical protein n=1 Tax=uncultured Ruminococcus sp. TaxID=165186 RepID=UPI00260B4174|nr:hypothetical protein [uncultured Ruminococcus sp.]